MRCPQCGESNTQPADSVENIPFKATVKHVLGRNSLFCIEPVTGYLWCNDCTVPFEGKLHGDPEKSRVRIITPYRSSQSK